MTTGGTYETGNLGYDTYGNPTGTFVVRTVGSAAGRHVRVDQYSYSSTGLMLSAKPRPRAAACPTTR